MRLFKLLLFFVMPALLGVMLSLKAEAANPVSTGNLPAARVALVIGNGQYLSGELKNPENDARAMAGALANLGFEVEYYANLKPEAMLQRIFDFFHHKAAKSELRVIYYAGHGVQHQGRSYLLPVDADLASPGGIPATGFLLDDLRENLAELPTGASMIILDTCRVNSCPVKPCRSLIGNPDITEHRRSAGMLIAYSTGPGHLAGDGGMQEHSLYTGTLLELLPTPGLPVEKLFRRVTEQVYRLSDGKQKPEFIDGLMGDALCLKSAPGGACSAGLN